MTHLTTNHMYWMVKSKTLVVIAVVVVNAILNLKCSHIKLPKIALPIFLFSFDQWEALRHLNFIVPTRITS